MMQTFSKFLGVLIISLSIGACSSPQYILNDSFKNIKGTNEMAVLIINTDNSINADLSQKIATIYKNDKGYNTTISLLSKQFITDGLFEKVFSGEKFDFEKQKIKNYADYICLGKLNTETANSSVGNNMTEATLTLEIKIINTSNGAAVNSFIKNKKGIGFSRQQAIEVATENIINDLK
jgi:hypothetical protein